MDPQLYELGVQLGDVAVRNTASAIADRVSAARARKKQEEVIAELEQIVNDLIADKNELVRIAQAYDQELVAQKISSSDIEYLSTHLIPIIRQLASVTPDQPDGSRVDEAIELFSPLLSVETVTILQLIGFNFKKALGEPLTELLARLISTRLAQDASAQMRLQELVLKRELAYIDLARDPESLTRLRELLSPPS